MFELVFLREILISLVHFLQLSLEAISVIFVMIGLLKTLLVLVQLKSERTARYKVFFFVLTHYTCRYITDVSRIVSIYTGIGFYIFVNFTN